VIYAAFCLSSFSNLIIFDVFLTNIGILLEVAALIALRIREPQLERPYRIPGGWFSIGAIVLSLLGVCGWAAWQQYAQEGTEAVTYCLWILAGTTLLYFPLERWRAAKARRDPSTDRSPGSAGYEAWLAQAVGRPASDRDAADRGATAEQPRQDLLAKV
jgi:amino acid transporter